MHGVVLAELNVVAANGLEIEHGVERRHLKHADVRHPQQIGDAANGGFRQPASGLLLGAPQQRQHRRGLAPWWIFGDLGWPRPNFQA